MLLRSDKTYSLTEQSKFLITQNNGPLCGLEQIRKHDNSTLYSVGDYTTKFLEDNGIRPKIEIFDLKTQRGEENYTDVTGSISINNPPGVITSELINAVESALKSTNRTFIRVIGEEDLAVLPIIFYAPLNSLVVYGIPGKGMGCITIVENVKNLVNRIFELMEVKE